MDKLKVLLIMLLSATAGLAMSMYILALIVAPNESPLNVLAVILTHGFSPNVPFLIPLSTLLFLCTVLASMVGVIYFLVLPEMKNYATGNGKDTVSVVVKTLKPEERSIVAILDKHDGTYLQKLITKEAGLSKLKIHRLIAALSERGIVHVEKHGNTNEVSLAKWFRDGMHESIEGGMQTDVSEMNISKLSKVEYILALMAVVLVLRNKKMAYTSLKEIREQSEIIEKSHGVKLVDNLENYIQDLSDRGILDIRSLNEIGISRVSPEKLEPLLDMLINRSRSLVREEKGKGK